MMKQTYVDVPPDIPGAFIVQLLNYYSIAIVGSQQSEGNIRLVIESTAVPDSCKDKLSELEETVAIGDGTITKVLRFVLREK